MLTRTEEAELHGLLAAASGQPAGAEAHWALRTRAVHALRCALREAMADAAREEAERGQPIGKHAAGRIFNRYMTIVAYTWFQTTAGAQKPNVYYDGQPVNQYGEFFMVAVLPMSRAFAERHRAGLVPTDWRAIKQRLERRGFRHASLMRAKTY